MKKFLLTFLLVATWLGCYAMRGDVNGDGTVTSADVTALYNYLLNGDTSSLANGDVNGDGNITSADITYVYNILLIGPIPETTEYTVNGVTFTMVDVEGGTFMMGAPSSDSYAEADEKPQHQVTVSSFAIGQTEVTQELWTAVMGSNPSLYDDNNKFPVHSITWNDCQNFIAALNSQLHINGYEFAMPTEAQWEFAARGGNQSRGYYYVGSNNIDDVAWYQSNSNDQLHEVGKKAANELGIYDMSGNVTEWCQDWKANYTSEAQVDPVGPDDGTYRVGRGGYYSQTANYCRISDRVGYRPNGYGANIGLRLVLVPAAKQTFTVNGVSFNMINVAGGTYMMGATDDDTEAFYYEKPRHRVDVASFAIGETEVTQALWNALMSTNPSQFSGNNKPVNSVSWDEGQEFISKLNAAIAPEGYEFRLPTEEEWEYAARGGNKSQGYKYAGSNNIDDVAWYDDNSYTSTQDVATKAPNELGIYDMSGNVMEWCGNYLYNYEGNCWDGFNHPQRGGWWSYVPRACRVTYRSMHVEENVIDYMGLRLVLAPKPEPLDAERILNSINMIEVEGGTFMMGANEGDNNAIEDEFPRHQVTVSTFSIAQTEVTQELWELVMGYNRSAYTRADRYNHPVENVSWNECQEFLTKLNAMTGRNFRLPTEAEWEFAARGGNLSQGYLYPGSNNVNEVAWNWQIIPSHVLGEPGFGTQTVATKAPNELGLYDMAGNVDELCSDWYAEQYPAEAQVNPTGPATGDARISRGGNWSYYSPDYCRISFRGNRLEFEHTRATGLRLAEGPSDKKTISVNGVRFNMIKVDGGTFMMGAPDSDTEAYDLERPAHQVTLSDYWIGETEVTEALWKAVMEVDAVPFTLGNNYPVRRMSWDQCMEFAQRLSQLTGLNFTLPTEAQWEFAARGGNLSHGYLYAGSANLDEVAWYAGNSGDVLHEVATKAPNELGIYDMCGNIAEWCLDDIYDYTTEPQVDPTHPNVTTNNMCRSSAWDDEAKDCRLTTRWKTNGSSAWIGFRLAIVPQS